MTMSNGNGGIQWKAIATAMWGVLVLGGGSWMTYMAGEVGGIKREQASDKKQAADQAGSVKVIEEKVRRLEQDTQEIKNKQDIQTEKLNELLRRVR